MVNGRLEQRQVQHVRWEAAARIDVVGLAEEFARTLRAELDYLREARNAEKVVLQIEPEGNHCCHNLYHVTRHAMADFLAETLNA